MLTIEAGNDVTPSCWLLMPASRKSRKGNGGLWCGTRQGVGTRVVMSGRVDPCGCPFRHLITFFPSSMDHRYGGRGRPQGSPLTSAPPASLRRPFPHPISSTFFRGRRRGRQRPNTFDSPIRLAQFIRYESGIVKTLLVKGGGRAAALVDSPTKPLDNRPV